MIKKCLTNAVWGNEEANFSYMEDADENYSVVSDAITFVTYGNITSASVAGGELGVGKRTPSDSYVANYYLTVDNANGDGAKVTVGGVAMNFNVTEENGFANIYLDPMSGDLLYVDAVIWDQYTIDFVNTTEAVSSRLCK